jgi:hypothetical protein
MSRPILPWRSPLFYIPAPDMEVWVRRTPWYDRPARAITNGIGGVGVTVVLLTSPPDEETITLDWSQIHTWKFQYLADELAAFPPDE